MQPWMSSLSIVHANLEFRNLPPSASLVLGLNMDATMPGLFSHILINMQKYGIGVKFRIFSL